MKKIALFSAIITIGLHALAQNVGIGTNNPSRAKLEVHGAVGATSAIFGGESTGVSLQRAWPGIGFNTYYGDGAHRYIANGYGSLLSVDPVNGFTTLDVFYHGAANNNVVFPNRAMVITPQGFVGIGSAKVPTAALQVARGVSFDGTAMFEGSDYHSYFNKGTDEHTHIRAGKYNGIVHINDIPGGKTNLYGKIGINTTAVEYPLEIKQSVFDKGLQFKLQGATWGMGMDFTGGLRFYFGGGLIGQFLSSTGHYQPLSDRRLKTNIRLLPAILPKLMQLKPVDYEMKHASSSNKKTIGFLAQEVKLLFPELVNVLSDTTHGHKGIPDLHTLDYSGFGVLAVKAIQEQQVLIEQQQQRLAKLEESMATLERKLAALSSIK